MDIHTGETSSGTGTVDQLGNPVLLTLLNDALSSVVVDIKIDLSIKKGSDQCGNVIDNMNHGYECKGRRHGRITGQIPALGSETFENGTPRLLLDGIEAFS